MKHRFVWAVGLWLAMYPAQAQLSHGGSPLPAETGFPLSRCVHDGCLELSSFNVDSVRNFYAEDDTHGPLRFAHKIGVNLNPDNSGQTFYTSDGTRVWRLGIRSKGAFSLNVVFDTFDIPPGARLFVYNPDRSCVLGAFTHENHQEGDEFPVAPVPGDEIWLEYQEPADAPFAGRLQLYEVNHDYLGLRSGPRFDILHLPCLPHLSCRPDLETPGRSVCLLIVNGDTYCTATFVNNTAQDGKPYLLTASHCLNDNPDLGRRSLIFLNYESPRCLASIQGSEQFSAAGCQTRALMPENDLALLELSQLPPPDYRPYLAGWNRSDSLEHDAPFLCIHHPMGEGKRYCTERDSLDKKDWEGPYKNIEPNNHWHVQAWEEGHTWTGSSGAPLFDRDYRLIGALTGGDSGGRDGCSAYVDGDYFARIDRAWDSREEPESQLKYWLDPLDLGLGCLDGLNPWKENAAQRISNLAAHDSIEDLRIEGYGYPFGDNAGQPSFLAEAFEVEEGLGLYGAYFMPARSDAGRSPVRIYVLSGEEPDIALHQAPWSLSRLDYVRGDFREVPVTHYADKENYLRLDSVVPVGRKFWLALLLPPPDPEQPADTFALYGTRHGSNSAWFFREQWASFMEFSPCPMPASLWIEPVVAPYQGSYIEPDLDDEEVVYAYHQETGILLFNTPDNWHPTVTIEVFDPLGRRLLRRERTSSPFQLPNDLARGVYLIRLSDALHRYSFHILR